MKAVFLDFSSMGPGLDLSELNALLPDLTVFDVTTPGDVADRIAGTDIVLTNKVRFDEALFQTAPSLRYIGLTATGTDNIDLDAAHRHGVVVTNIRDYCTRSVAEHVFAGVLSLARNLPGTVASVRNGKWQESDDFCLLDNPIRELSTMTLGIVGFGVLGRGVAATGEAFGMRLLISERPGSNDQTPGRVAFESLLDEADVISLHCPLNAATQNLISEEELRRMKSSAILVNTARGGLIDSSALVAALSGGDIAGAVIDVLAEEPPVNGDPLLDYQGDNLSLTPHIAWASHTARQAAIDELSKNLAAFFTDESRNRVTPTPS